MGSQQTLILGCMTVSQSLRGGRILSTAGILHSDGPMLGSQKAKGCLQKLKDLFSVLFGKQKVALPWNQEDAAESQGKDVPSLPLSMQHGTVTSRGLGIKWLQQHQCFSTRQRCRALWGWHSTTSGPSADVGTQSISASSSTGTKSITLAENVGMCHQREET